MADNAPDRTDSGATVALHLWDEARNGRVPVKVPVPRHVITVSELHEALGALIANHPHHADLPVHLLNMEPEDDTDENVTYHGLLTDIETDVLDDRQGLVLDLLSWPSLPPKNGRPS